MKEVFFAPVWLRRVSNHEARDRAALAFETGTFNGACY
jgi:hypothetical protein